MKNKRIVNLRFKVCGLHFDAAIDCDWELHCYDEIKHNITPIELYCFDKPEWDIRMMYLNERNDQQEYHLGLSTRAQTLTKSRPRRINGCAK